MKEPEIKNAKISSVSLGYEDHGILTCMLMLDYGGICQGFGGYRLDEYNKNKKKSFGSAYGMQFIINVLKTVGVDSWENIEGKYIRVEAISDKVHRIGHITEDKWFDPEKDMKEFLGGS